MLQDFSELSEAQITKDDDQGRPSGGNILISSDADGKGWFIDSTVLDLTAFDQTLSNTAFRASTDSAASGHYDLLTALLHEEEHLAGFIDDYSGFDRHVQTVNGFRLFVGDDFTASLVEDHLDPKIYPYNLINPTLSPGVRKLPSLLDAKIITAARSTTAAETTAIATSKDNFPDTLRHWN